MRLSILMLTLLATALWSAPGLAQQKQQLGPLCTTHTTPPDRQIDACNKILALKVFTGDKLATIYFWRAIGWNKKGNYTQVIADTTEALKLKPAVAIYNLRGSAYFDKASMTSRSPTSTTRCGSARRKAASSTTTAAMPGAARATTPRRSPITTPPSNTIRREASPIRTAACRRWRSAISTARSPISTKRSGSIRHCLRPGPSVP